MKYFARSTHKKIQDEEMYSPTSENTKSFQGIDDDVPDLADLERQPLGPGEALYAIGVEHRAVTPLRGSA